jgi:AraC-like DNA-binding protein
VPKVTIDLPLNGAPAPVPLLEQELAFSGFRFAVLPPGYVDAHFELTETVVDLPLRVLKTTVGLNSDLVQKRTLSADCFGFIPAGSRMKIAVNNLKPSLLLSYVQGFEAQLATENLQRDVQEWRVVDYEPDPTGAALGRMAMAWFQAPVRPDPLYVESLGVAVFARGAHLALREGQLWQPAAVTGYEARVQRAVDWAQAHLDGCVTLADMAAAAFVSPFHFLRVFKAATGETPHAFVTRLRVERARDWLVNRDWPIDRIAQECGFGSASRLGQAFRALTGETPAAFRRSQLAVSGRRRGRLH